MIENKTIQLVSKNKILLPKWVRSIAASYFSTPLNAAITLLMAFLLVKVIIALSQWAFLDAVWVASSKAEADGDGAVWAFIGHKLRFFFYGFYPEKHLWRINVAGLVFFGCSSLLLIPKVPHKIYIFAALMLICPLVTYVFLYGGPFFEKVATNSWGGLTLTLLLASMGLLYSFPVGILLAFGRRSELPVVRIFSISYIEFFRGIPLITILFLSSVVVPFFLPAGASVDKILRIIIGMTFFQSAYLAEVIRGGLQAIPHGQYEAADSLGFQFWLKSYLIILPQVLKVTVSNIGSISISFLKDTTLVLIIGLFDLLGIVTPLTSDSNWLGLEPEGLIFAGLIYWILCFSISKITRITESRLHRDAQ